MIKLAIVGGRDFRNYDKFETIVKTYIQKELGGKYPNFIVSGGAEGVDTMAEIFASLYDIETIIYEPKNFNREELLGRNITKGVSSMNVHIVWLYLRLIVEVLTIV